MAEAGPWDYFKPATGPAETAPWMKFAKGNEPLPPKADFAMPEIERRVGQTGAELLANAKKPGVAPSDDPLMVNLGGHLKKTLTGMARILLPKGLEDRVGLPGDEARQEDEAMARGLEGTPGSTTMGLVGDTLPTLPVGGPLASGAKLLGTAARSLPAVAGAVRAATSAPVRAGLEGAFDAASTADTGEGGAAGGTGAALGTGMSLFGKTAGVLGRGLVKKSDEALALANLGAQHGEDVFLPLAQAASDGDLVSRLAKGLYAEALPMLPGTSGRLKKQGEAVLEKTRKMAMKDAAPDGFVVPDDAGKRAGEVVRDMKAEFNKQYTDTVKAYAFNVPPDFRKDLVAKIKAKFPNIDDASLNAVATKADQEMARYSSGKAVIDGENMLNVKNEIGRGWGAARGSEKGAVEVAQDHIDEIIEAELKQGNSASNLADLKKYQDLSVPYRGFGALRRATTAAKKNRGNFTPSQLARGSREGSDMLDLAQTAHGATEDAVTGRTPNWVKFAGGTGILGGAAAVGGIPGALGAIGGGQILSTEFIQKALMGDTKAQKAMIDYLRQNPGTAEKLGALTRNIATTQTGEGYGAP